MKSKFTLFLAFLIIFIAITSPIKAANQVQVEKVEVGEISEEKVISGQAVPAKTIAVMSTVNAEIEKMNVELGDYVEKGEKLVIFEDDQLQVQLDQAKAALKSAKANYERLKKGANENDKNASLANIKQAEASLEMARSQHELLIKGASDEDLKSAKESYNQAKASYEGAKKSLKTIEKIYNDKTSLKQQLNNAEIQKESSKRQWESSKNRLEQSKLSLEQAENSLAQAKKEYNRIKNLYEDGAVTEKEFDAVKSQYDNAKISVRNAESAVISAEIAVEQAKISYEGAKKSYELTKEMFNDPTELKQQLESAKTQVEVSRANMEIAKANYEKAKKGARDEEKNSSIAQVKQAEAALESAKANHEKLLAGASDEEIKASEAQVEQAQASLEQARLRLEDAIIESPISGYIATLNGEEGQLMGQGSSLITIVKLDPIYVNLGVSSELLTKLEKGDQVEVEFLDFENKIEKATIEMISPMRDQQSQLYNVKVKLDNKNSKIKAGMFADVYFDLDKKDNAILVSVDAVNDIDGKPYVFVEENNKAIKRNVKLGIISKNKVEILEGLSEGEDVIIEGNSSLQNGDSVEVVN